MLWSRLCIPRLFFLRSSRTFTAGTMHCKWKSGKGELPAPDDRRGESVNSHVMGSSQAWTCSETKGPPRRRPSTSSSTIDPIIAIFYPPQVSLIKSEITIYAGGRAIVDHVILTAILICARKDEWRTVQSTLTRATLEASLKAEIHNTLPPPYNPTAADRYRVSSPRAVRRLQSANVARGAQHTPPAPPPYTSVDDISLRNG